MVKEEFHSSPFPIWVMGKDCKVFSILLLHEKHKWLPIFFKKNHQTLFPLEFRETSTNIYIYFLKKELSTGLIVSTLLDAAK